METAGLKIDVLSDGTFGLDGGAMFGMVPRERWKELCPPDERNRIRLGTHTLCVRGPGFVLLVDPGVSLSADPEMFAIRRNPTLEESLAGIGLAPEDVTHVTMSHLHFDHAGGGRSFPNAEYLVQEAEWAAATSPHLLHSRSYRREDLPPEDRVRLLPGDGEILPGVRVRVTGGPSAGHQVLLFEDRAVFFGDLLPTIHHLSPPRTMAYDLEPRRVVDVKLSLFREAAEKGWLGFLYHDLSPDPIRIVSEGRRFRAVR